MSERGDLIEIEDPVLREPVTVVPTLLLRDPGLSPAAKTVYMLLLSYAWQDGFCFPGQERMAEDLGISRPTLRSYLRELSEARYITARRRGPTSNVYVILTRPAQEGKILSINKKERILPTRRKESFHYKETEDKDSATTPPLPPHRGVMRADDVPVMHYPDGTPVPASLVLSVYELLHTSWPGAALTLRNLAFHIGRHPDLDPVEQAENCVSYMQAKGRTVKSGDATFRNWLPKADKRPRHMAAASHAQPAARRAKPQSDASMLRGTLIGGEPMEVPRSGVPEYDEAVWGLLQFGGGRPPVMHYVVDLVPHPVQDGVIVIETPWDAEIMDYFVGPALRNEGSLHDLDVRFVPKGGGASDG